MGTPEQVVNFMCMIAEEVRELRALSEQRFRAPDGDSTRTYSVPTLERWLYAYRANGLAIFQVLYDGKEPGDDPTRSLLNSWVSSLNACVTRLTCSSTSACATAVRKSTSQSVGASS